MSSDDVDNLSLNLNKNVECRTNGLAITNVSNINEISFQSSLTDTHPISMEYNRRLVNEIIDNTFDEQRGTCDLSSSECSSLKSHSSEYSYDKRLEYWKNVLKEREKISTKIRRQTKKAQCDILYNRLTTVDQRDKCSVKNLLDYAQRLNPTNVSALQPAALKEKCNAETSTLMPKLLETLPQTERLKTAHIEITGVPIEIQRELLGKSKCPVSKKPFSWLNSKHLENRIEERREDIKRVLEFYPDTENLQIVGEGLLNSTLYKRNSNIEIIPCNNICKISTDSHVDSEVNMQENPTNALEPNDYAVQVNEQTFPKSPRYSGLRTLIFFSCHPFETEVKKIFTIQNVGRKVLDFEWVYNSFYGKNSTLLKSYHKEFLFDSKPFRLCSGEAREVYVKYQPRRVKLVKSKWILKVKPLLFKPKTEGIVMILTGTCTAPVEYLEKLEELQREVIDKSNKKMVKTLITNLITLAIDSLPSESISPYQRCLSEMELFEQLNLGFKCERYHDLELLKELHKRSKKPRDKLWDLRVKTLKSCILKAPQGTARALLFNELSGILSSMSGNSVDLETKLGNDTEKYRNCFLFVRGTVATAIDEWVDLISAIEETFYQSTLSVSMKNVENQVQNDEEIALQKDKAKSRQYVVEQRVRKLKIYRDAIYMQTYTLLCDFAENIANVIESTA